VTGVVPQTRRVLFGRGKGDFHDIRAELVVRQPEKGETSVESAVIVLQIVFGVLGLACAARIVARAGYPWWYSLALLIPVLNVAVLVLFAFGEWPLEKQAFRYRMREADDDLHDPSYLLKRWVKKAAALERAGQTEEAIRIYERIADTGEPGNADLARTAIARLRSTTAPPSA
jgi:hypothetical protein